jgi:hypothetical protein
MKSSGFFAELKRRNVYKVAVAYIVGGWALSQGIAQVFPVFAFEWLQSSFDERDGGALALAVDSLLRGLRDDPRYKNFLAKLGLPTSS